MEIVPTPSTNLPRAILLDVTEGGLAMARALVKHRVPVYVLARRPYAFVLASRGVEGALLPDLPEGRDAWLLLLGDQAKRGLGVIFSCSDAATELLVQERARIPADLRSFEAQASAHQTLMDKAQLYPIATQLGISVPSTRSVGSRVELDAVAANSTYPVVLKPALSHLWDRHFGRTRTALVHSGDELRAIGTRALGVGLKMLVSELIPGDDDHLEGVTMVRAQDGRFTLGYGRRKVRQFPPDFGGIHSMARSAPVPETMQMCRRILDFAGYVGVGNLEAKRHAVTGERFLIEINVRVPQGFGLGDACGADASWRLYATLAGLYLGHQPQPKADVRSIHPVLDARSAWRRVRAGRDTWWGVLRSYRGTRDVGVLDPRDPGPGTAFIRSKLRGAVPGRRRARKGD